MHMDVCVRVYGVRGCLGGHIWLSEPLELESQVMSCLMWMQGGSGRARDTRRGGAISFESTSLVSILLSVHKK